MVRCLPRCFSEGELAKTLTVCFAMPQIIIMRMYVKIFVIARCIKTRIKEGWLILTV